MSDDSAGDLASRIAPIADCRVDARLDRLLRELLRSSFDDVCFDGRRFANETPSRRFLIDLGTHVAAHLAVHEKLLHTESGARGFIGIAEVCVAPAYRGRGLVSSLLASAESEYAHLDHTLLLGEAAIYGSSGYRPLEGVRWPDDPGAATGSLLGKHLAAQQWPVGARRIHGPRF